MNVVEGSHHTFHPDGWQQIEASNTPASNTPDTDTTLFDYGASFDKEIADAKQGVKEIQEKGGDSSFAQATAQYLLALQSSYRHLQVTEPHLSPELVVSIGEARACRELCSAASASAFGNAESPEFKAIDLAASSIDWEKLPTDEADTLIDSLTGTYKAKEDAIVQHEHPWKEGSSSPIHSIIEAIPTPEARKLFLHTNEDGSLSALARYIDNEPSTSSQLVHTARLFLSAMQSEHGLADMHHHPVIARLIDKLGGPESADIIDGEYKITKLPSDERFDQKTFTHEDVDAHNKTYDHSIQEYFMSSLTLPRDLITTMSSAMKSRLKRSITIDAAETTDQGKTPASSESIYERASVVKAMLRIGENVRVLGAETIERLHRELGVVNLDRYNPEDLQTMVKLLDKDPATIEHLQQGDVLTVLSDAQGDWNGAFNNSLDNVRRSTGRSLMFEITKPSDFYRHMLFLKQRGIKPSALSIDAHGLPGLTQFGSSTLNGGFFLTSGYHSPNANPEVEKKNLNVSLFEANIPRLFSNEFFQPSRGIDDAGDWIGSTQIIINSCSSDVSNDEWLQSTAETIAKRSAKYRGEDRFNVIGATDVLYVRNSPLGLRFTNEADEGIGVKLTGEVIPPTKKERILAALKSQKAPEKLNIIRTNYAVIPVSNSLRKVA